MKKNNPNKKSLFEEVKPKFIFDPYAKTEEERLDGFTDFIIERHKIYLRRKRGDSKPWTTDPVLQVGKFTNVFRRLDPGSTWIIDNIIKPYEDNPNLWIMLSLARIINWPDTLQEMMDKNVWPIKKWNAEKTFHVLQDRQDRGDQLVTGAYICNSVFPSDYPSVKGTKAEYIPMLAIDPMWKARKEREWDFKHSMQKAIESICSFRGIGPFIGNQILVDLSYSNKWLGRAEDLNTFTSPGPGTIKGCNWVLHGAMNKEVNIETPGKKLGPSMIRLRKLTNKMIKDKIPKKLWTSNAETGFEEISMPDISNCWCETAKMVRSIMDGDTKRMKNKYNGTGK